MGGCSRTCAPIPPMPWAGKLWRRCTIWISVGTRWRRRSAVICPASRRPRGRPGWKSMRARLAPDELLIEIVAFDKHYGAFLLDHAGALRWVDLGPARPIDQAVRDLIEGANDWSVSLAHGEEAGCGVGRWHGTGSAAPAFETARAVARSHRPESIGRRLRISPDGLLTLVPFAALPDSHGHFLIERFAISYLSAARDLVASENAGHPTTPPVIALSPGADGSHISAARSRKLARCKNSFPTHNCSRWAKPPNKT